MKEKQIRSYYAHIQQLDTHLGTGTTGVSAFGLGRRFVGYENENIRQGLVATGTMAFPPNHPLCLAAIKWIQINK